ncbi:hypothetical protein DERF_014214 [Dermatophagoides farinae]|uniref:Ig-like domain-containing protein n=1 Tax=Dermatophagoides farinae TaxID=6954 RepID=A0A922HLP0_DERFA|nr:hypothetical protein DERF_014214 [Dermatophagoides farinae]
MDNDDYDYRSSPPKIRKAQQSSSTPSPTSSYYSLLYPVNDNNLGTNPKQKSSSSLQNNRFFAVLGEPGHLECLVESVPSPIAITWIHNGQIFTSGSANNIPINIDIHEETLKEEMVVQRTSFDIRQTFENDFGYYNCVVVNSYGSDWHLVSLEEKTSFSTIVIFVAIAILILVFVVLTTTILLLSIKHRNLVKQQQQRQNQETESDGEKDSKEHYMGSLDNPDNHNIYSTHSTRTNSSSAHYFLDKNGPTETGTIITRSGSTGSQRSSTSSSFPVYLDQPTSSSSPGPNTGIISRTINSLHNHQRRSPHSQLMNNQAMQFGTMNGANVSHHPHHHQRPTSPPFFANSVFDTASELNSPMISNNNMAKSDQIVAMPPLSSTNYSTLTRHLASIPNSNRNSYSPYLAQQFYQQQQQQQFDNNIQMAANQNPISSPSTIDMYQANPYSVHSSQPIGIAVNNNRVKSTPMPTPPPSLAKELDNCISKISIATHV